MLTRTIVDADGILVTATGWGSKEDVIVESMDPDLVEQFHRNAEERVSVPIVHLARPFTAGYDTALEVAAALCWVRPGRTSIVETTPEVKKAIFKAAGPQTPGIVY